MRQYAALMVDIRDSRKMDEARRRGVQELFFCSLEYLNALFHEDLVRDVVFSAGDEVQGLFTSAAAAYLYHRALSLLLVRADVRGGVGCGTWDVRVEGAPSTAQDGTAYHNARDAIEFAHRNRMYDFALMASAPSPVDTVMANYPLLLASARTARQAELARQVELLYPLVLHGDEASCRRAYELRPRLKRAIESCGEAAVPWDSWMDAPLPVDVAELDGEGVMELPAHLSGLSYRMEASIGRTRQSIDRLMDGGMVNQERVAAAAVARSLLEREGGGIRG